MAKPQPVTVLEGGTGEPKTYIVVGGGVFGLSTIFWLLKAEPSCTVILIDPTALANPQAASHDISKILRDDYPNPLYAALAIKALEHWRNDSSFKAYYHQVGVIRADPSDHSDMSRNVHRNLGHQSGAKWMTPEEVRTAWPAFATADFGGLEQVMYNPNCGWVEAASAMEAIRQKIIDDGAKLVVGEVSTLLFDGNGDCTGVRLADGDEMNGTVLLCTGARTSALLAESAPDRKDLHAGDRIRATGAVSFTTSVQGEQKERFRGVPVLKNRVPSVKGKHASGTPQADVNGRTGESMGMTPDGILKFNCDMAFTFNQFHVASGDTMSLAPSTSDLTQWTTEDRIPKHLREQACITMKGLYGDEMAGKHIEQYRICW